MSVALWILGVTELALIVLLLIDRRRLNREWQIRFDARWHKSGRRIHDEQYGNEPTREQVNRLTPGVYYFDDE